MKILVDECLPEELVEWLKPVETKTVQQTGWAGVQSGELLRRAEIDFDLFLTADKRIRYQQNLEGRRLAILVLPSNRLTVLRAILDSGRWKGKSLERFHAKAAKAAQIAQSPP